MYYIIVMENVLGSAGPALTFLILVSLPLIQTIASSAVIPDLKFLIS
jgi:hypothetical protein